MRKLMVMTAMLAMMLALASPAFAQTNITTGNNTEFNAVCQNIIGQVNVTGNQNANANANAMGGGDAVAVARVHQSQNISVMQSNRCLNNFHNFHKAPKAHFVWWKR